MRKAVVTERYFRVKEEDHSATGLAGLVTNTFRLFDMPKVLSFGVCACGLLFFSRWVGYSDESHNGSCSPR